MAHEPMSERVRDVGDGLILAFPQGDTRIEGKRLETVELFFFRVSSAARYFQRYTALGNITSGSTSPTDGYDYLGDTGVGTGSDIFRVEEDDWHLLHFGFGTSHPDLQVFSTVSAKSNGDPAIDRTGSAEDIVPGTDDRGWVASPHIENIYDPPALTERVSFKNNSDGEFLEWAFHNDGPNTLSGGDLELFFTGRGYKVMPVPDREMQDLMLEMALRRPRDPVIDSIYHQVGGVGAYTLGTNEPDSWNDMDSFKRTFRVDDLPGQGRRATPGMQAD